MASKVSRSPLLDLRSTSRDYEAVDVSVPDALYETPVLLRSSAALRLESCKPDGKFGIAPAGFRLTSGFADSPRPPGPR